MTSKAEVYEVQTLNNGRWTIQSRCRTEDQAIAEAHEFFDRRQCIGVKVVKEAFDESAKLYREHTVFRLPASTAQNASKNRSGSAPGAKPQETAPAAHDVQAAPRRRGIFELLAALRP